ncbi:MAG: NADH-quinone oxidoreductase subunit NuoE [Rickettsiales bacterium]|nr:NADH-quinone oxidoreductase subunit NuoE [Rickettsiales bacterium]
MTKIANQKKHEPEFSFSKENVEHAKAIIARYPAGKQQSAVMPLLTLAQKQNRNYLSKSAMDYVASILGMAPVRVYEVASFYTMYNLEPVGEYMIEICTTTPCWLRGSDAIVAACEKKLGIKVGETTPDGKFTLKEAECLGACVNAPMCQVGEHYYEDLTPDMMSKLVDEFALGHDPKPGPQSGRRSSEPMGDQ